uniref:Uncharacterized protein n=1 Tax=Aegilops tauschii subsp. strangulata TaxID=200361 RepID=A0A453S1H6_AEGTS
MLGNHEKVGSVVTMLNLFKCVSLCISVYNVHAPLGLVLFFPLKLALVLFVSLTKYNVFWSLPGHTFCMDCLLEEVMVWFQPSCFWVLR